MADIIARAAIARGTFYLYFQSKDQLLLAILDRFHSLVRDAFEALDGAGRAAQSGGPQAVLEASFRAWLEFFAGHADAVRVVLREARAIDDRFERALSELRQSALTRFAARFRNFQAQGQASASIDPGFAAHVQLGVLEGLLGWCVLANPPADVSALARQFADLEWNGIRPRRNEDKFPDR